MIKNIIFDWSGTVKDALRSHLWIVNRMFRKFNANEISLEELKENWKQPYMFSYNKYLPDLTIEQEQAAYKEALLHHDCPESAAYPGIPELIRELKEKGISLAVISSDLPDTVFPEIKKYGLENIFNHVLTNVYDKVKVLQDLIEKNNFNPEETYIIGDSNHEIESGKKAGVKTIAVTWGFNTEQNLKLESPDFIVHNLEELKRLVLL